MILTFLFSIFALILFAQNSNTLSILISKRADNRIVFVLQNISKDTVYIEEFLCVQKRKKNFVNNYSISSDTLKIDFSLCNPVINSPYKIDYYIDGERIKKPFKFYPTQKLSLNVLLNRGDYKRFNFISIQLNQSDRISVKL